MEIRIDPWGIQSGLTTDLGYVVGIESAHLVFETIEILPCEEAPEPLAWDLLRWLSPVGSARAHGIGTPTRFATPVIHDLLTPTDGGTLAGYLYPPADSYCSVRVAWGPADEDALGLDEAPHMVDLSLHVKGTWARVEGEHQSFEITTPMRFDAELVVGPAGEPWEVALPGSPHVLPLALNLAGFLDGVDFEGADSDEWGAVLLMNLPELMGVELTGP